MKSSANTVRRSQTHSFALPNIKKSVQRYKVHSTRLSMLQRPSSFVSKLKDETPDLQYQYTESQKISQQQNKLKKLLREFNQDTLEILSSRLHKMNQKSYEQKHKPVPPQTVAHVRTREIENNNHIISFCQKQIQNLQSKCQNLKYLSQDDFIKKIHDLEKEIEQQINQNKTLIRQNTLRGLKMTKNDPSITQLRQMEYDKFILAEKKVKLAEQQQNLQKEIKATKQKQQKLGKQIQEADFSYQAAIKEQEQRKLIEKQKQNLQIKQKNKKLNKQRKSAVETKYQHFYFKILRDLQDSVKKTNQTDNQIQVTQIAISNAKKQIESLQERLNNINQGPSIMLTDINK